MSLTIFSQDVSFLTSDEERNRSQAFPAAPCVPVDRSHARSRSKLLRAAPEVTLLSIASRGADTGVGRRRRRRCRRRRRRCCRCREKRQKKREEREAANKTRCESHLLFNRWEVVCVASRRKPWNGVGGRNRGTAPLRV
ncbi:hypothetical protein ANTRET_LOCUS1779 [Anthophora retusa]